MATNEATRHLKMHTAINEYQQWLSIVGVRTVAEFNQKVKEGHAAKLINVAEALQERKIVLASDEIARCGARLVLIAGPSSSGKTTLSKRLAIQLLCCGLHPHTLSTDNYFVNRVDTPLDENGEYDFECIEAEDTGLLCLQLQQLLAGERVELPRYDFQSGERRYEGKFLQIGESDIIIIEGNHALNPLLTAQVADESKYKIYVSTLSTIAIDDSTSVPKEDIRLLRRILRDHKYRGFTPQQTIARCPSVHAGEKKWIYPFQDNADVTFNSALLYELNVLHNPVMPLLAQVTPQDKEYAEAQRLSHILRCFMPIPSDQVPATSLLREFAGGSLFKY